MKKGINKEKLDRYRAALPWGGQVEVARRAGASTKSISDFLNGKYASPRVEYAILEVIADHKNKLERLQKEAGFL